MAREMRSSLLWTSDFTSLTSALISLSIRQMIVNSFDVSLWGVFVSILFSALVIIYTAKFGNKRGAHQVLPKEPPYNFNFS